MLRCGDTETKSRRVTEKARNGARGEGRHGDKKSLDRLETGISTSSGQARSLRSREGETECRCFGETAHFRVCTKHDATDTVWPKLLDSGDFVALARTVKRGAFAAACAKDNDTSTGTSFCC